MEGIEYVIAQSATGLTAASESGFIIGFLIGLAVGVFLARWLWINGQMHRERALWRKKEKTDAVDTDS